MPEWEQLVRHEVDPEVPAPTLDQLFHRTRASERVASTWKGVAVGAVVLSLVVIGALIYSVTLFNNQAKVTEHRADVRGCKDRAFAFVIDHTQEGKYKPGTLTRLYAECDRDPNAHF